MLPDPIDDEELLYRSVRNSAGCFKFVEGEWLLHDHAFTDPDDRPSVDRASLQGYNPRRSLQPGHAGVVSFTAGQVRMGPAMPGMDGKGRSTGQSFLLDVIAEPKETNQAHAVIVLNPQEPGLKHLRRRLLSRLAEIAQWEIQPPSPISPSV